MSRFATVLIQPLLNRIHSRAAARRRYQHRTNQVSARGGLPFPAAKRGNFRQPGGCRWGIGHLGFRMAAHGAQSIYVQLERVNGVTKSVEASFDDPEPDQECNDKRFKHARILSNTDPTD